ncbi:MAG: efflux RND transporter permease subunit [Terriglobales bacterium]
MIHRLVQLALRQRFMVVLIALLVAAGGIVSFHDMPLAAYPDLSPPMVEVITQWPGHAAEEVERLVTLPIELAFNATPHLVYMRSISLYGLSDVTLTFKDGTDIYWARNLVYRRMMQASLPAGVTPSMSPDSSPSDLIYRYVVESPDRTPQELKTIEDWVLERDYKSIPGVADDSGFGGTVMQYQVLLNPVKLYAHGLTVAQVDAALAANNANTGGGFYSRGGQFYYVRGVGLIRDQQDIADVVVASHDGVPVYIKDVGKVVIGHAPRLGEYGFMNNDDAVEGVIMMRTGAKAQVVLRRVEAMTHALNRGRLPPDVKVLPFYDRIGLIHITRKTIEDNLTRGLILVFLVLLFFLVSVRAAIITALTIPLALLFAFILMHGEGIGASLLSIGAIDFGVIIDGTVVMMENIFRELGERQGTQYNLFEVIAAAAKEVDRPIFYSVAVIIAGYLPIYALSGPSGKLFHPMADTMVFALIGALIITLTLVPVLTSLWFKGGARDQSTRLFEWIKSFYAGRLRWCLRHPWVVVGITVALFAAAMSLVPTIGGEFMPHLDEGALWVRATMPYSISWKEAARISPQIRAVLRSYPQVTYVGSELGRPDDGTDSTGFFNDEFFVGLRPYNDPTWKESSAHTKQELIASMRKRLSAFPGIIVNFTQPAEDAVDEALTGLKSALAVKIYGPNLQVLQAKALQIKEVLSRVRGFTSLVVIRELGQPSLVIHIDRQRAARYGINVADAEDVIQAAIGGQTATQVIQGEKLFDLVVRMQPQYRQTTQAIGQLLVGDPGGRMIPLSQIATIQEQRGASFIYRQNGSRYIGVQYSVVGRDLAGAVAAGQKAVQAQVHLPFGYHVTWGGEYSEYVAAKKQLSVVGPLALALIFLILFSLYGNFKFPLAVFLSVILTEPIGAVVALKITHTPFSVSSGIGFLALLGVSAEMAVIMVSYANQLRLEGKPIPEATHDAALLRLRPILMTAMVACLGLLPAATSHGIGSDSQRPFAIVIVGGMVMPMILGFFVYPVFYKLFARDGDTLQV